MSFVDTHNHYTHQGDLFRFGFTQCEHCGTLVHQDAATRAVYYNHTNEQVTDDFCGDHCKQEAYIKRLQKAGL